MLIALDQRSNEAGWKAWRNDVGDGFPRITATRALTFGGFNPYKSAWRETAEMIGLVPELDISNNPFVKRGIEFEPEAVKWLSHKKGKLLEQGYCFESDDFPEFGASPDSVELDPSGSFSQPVRYIGEIKVPCEQVFSEVQSLGVKSTQYQLYTYQVIWQMGTCSVKDANSGELKADICFYNPDDPDSSIVLPVKWDEEVFNQMIEVSVKCRQSVVLGEIPSDFYPDFYIPNEEEADRIWQTLAFEAFDLQEREDELAAKLESIKSRKEEIRDELLTLMGTKDKGNAYGVQITRYRSEGAIDWKAALKSLDQSFDERKYDQFRRDSSTRVKMTVKR